MATSTQFFPRVSPDWVYSFNSNVSVAKDRSWFTSYTPFKSHLGSFSSEAKLKVMGIGTVHIPVRLPSSKKGKKHGIIEIRGVLHAPNALCNILGQGDFTDRYELDTLRQFVKDREGRTVACIDKTKKLFCLKLSGPPVGPITTPSPLLKDSGNHVYINAQWAESERKRWEVVQPYTEAEVLWLKRSFESENAFLQKFDLSIRKNKDRERGRMLARMMMGQITVHVNDPDRQLQGDDSNYKDESDDDDLSSVNSEASLAAQLADVYFSQKQLDWIKKHYHTSGHFLRVHGLKPWQVEDYGEVKSIVHTLMGLTIGDN